MSIRKAVTDRSVRPLVDGLVALFLSEGSVNAVHRRLADALGKEGGTLYPNRLHALLSEDPTRGVNPKTVAILETAFQGVSPALTKSARARADALRARVLAAWAAAQPGVSEDAGQDDARSTVRRLAADLTLPPAVVRWLLADARAIKATPRSTPVPASQKPDAGIGTTGRGDVRDRGPDWSYQDDAYRAAIRSLSVDPNRKAGLVIPTGGGKTRIGVRILLRVLADSRREDGVVLWITHRRFLGTQARRELQRALNEGTPDLPDDAVRLLAERVHVVMLTELARRLDEFGDRVVLAVVDEAHHAAAPSYTLLFERRPLRGLFLTATPNRTDGRAIGVDEIAYTISYRELFDRGVLVEPTFEEPLLVPDGGWDGARSLADLADYVVERAQGEFVKTIVVASRVDHVEAMHGAIVRTLEEHTGDGGHVLGPADIGFVHGSASSSGIDPEEFLDEFLARPRGVLVTTGQMLGEGFDDPAVNAVVVTYPTTSMVQLMQAAGRCLRSAPGKRRAFVVQAKESPLAYHYEQRWLYKDISDRLRPQLVDRLYRSAADLEAQVELILDAHRVDANVRAAVLARLAEAGGAGSVSLLLTGLPYSGDPPHFTEAAEWGAVPITAASRDLFLRVFNDFSVRVDEVRFATDFLRLYAKPDPTPGGEWTALRDMLTAMEYARREIGGEAYWGAENRAYRANRGTTWLIYISFRFEPVVPAALEDFLADAVNRDEVVAAYAAEPARWRACAKVTLPLGGTLAYGLDADQSDWLRREREHLLDALRGASPADSFARLEAWRSALPSCPLPLVLAQRIEGFLSIEGHAAHLLPLECVASGAVDPLRPAPQLRLVAGSGRSKA